MIFGRAFARGALIAAAALVFAGTADAQIIPGRATGGRQTNSQQRDSTARDTLKWTPPDSLMQALMALKGYEITRFQGSSVRFEAPTRALDLYAGSGGTAQVSRGKQTVTSDTVISYREGQFASISAGGRYCGRDPSSPASEICGTGNLTYLPNERAIRSTNAGTEVDNGEVWKLLWDQALIVAAEDSARRARGDTTRAPGATMYLKGVTMTACLDSVPHFFLKTEEVKRTAGNTLITGPATLYLTDGKDIRSAIPVAKFPFFFQAIHGGRRSGILTPRFGISDIVRNSPSYRRNIENLGYFVAINDFMNASIAMDWRSGAGSAGGSALADPGWMRWQVDWDYIWLDRAITGGTRTTYMRQNDGSTNLGLNWNHNQKFSHGASLRLSTNYVTNTRIHRQNSFDPYQATASIRSDLNYQREFGPTQIAIGGRREQFPGRLQVNQSFPTISITSKPIKLAGEKVVWTPAFNFGLSESKNLDQRGAFEYRYLPTGDSAQIHKSQSSSTVGLRSPVKFFGLDLNFGFNLASERIDFPQEFTIYDVVTGDSIGRRIYNATYRSTLDIQPGFTLPSFSRSFFNIVPSVSLQNVDAGPYYIKSERTDGKWVHQGKRPTFGLSASPAIYGLFGGIGPFAAFRHSINPTIGYAFAPAATVSDEYLAATGRTRKGYLGSLMQSAVSFGVSTALEGKVATKQDSGMATATGLDQKIKLLSLNFSSLTYDFRRADTLKAINSHWWRGLTTDRFDASLKSDLLPGVDLSGAWSLFQGNTWSDTAEFKPFLQNVSASLNLSRGQNPFVLLARLFGANAAAPPGKTAPEISQPQPSNIPPDEARRMAELAREPLAGGRMSGARMIVPPSQGWRLALTFTTARQRTPRGGNLIEFDPRAKCEQVAQGNAFILDACLQQARLNPTGDLPITSQTIGGPVYRVPATSNAGGDFSFSLTPNWTASWRTNYDFVRHEFAQHVVSLQRDIHDWRAIFAFTQSPNGNFAFNFSVALKAQPDAKIDYNRATVRGSNY